MEPIIKSLAILLFVTLSYSVPIEWQSSQYTQSCLTDPQFLRYDLGKTYVYQLETQSRIQDLQGEWQTMGIQSSVELSVHSNCDLSLQLRQTRVLGVDPQTALELSQQLDEEPIQFGYDDGVVTSVRPSQQDYQWAVDVKKAIISSLQMSSKSPQQKTLVLERDILGECPTLYQPITKRYTTQVLQKTKYLNKCQSRQSSLIGLFPRYYGNAENLPLANSSYLATQTLDKDLITGATIQEEMQLRGVGIRVENTLNLRFEKQLNSLNARQVQQFRVNTNHLLMSSHFQSTQNTDLVEVLRTVCQQLESERQELTVESFPQLIEAISQSKQLQRVAGSVQEVCSNKQLFDLFLDALVLSSNPDSAQILLEYYQSGRVSTARANYLFSLLSFQSEPNEKSIETYLPLLRTSQQKQVILGISGLIHNAKYSLKSSSVDPLIQRAIDILVERLQSSSRDSQQTIAVIKALNNIGVESHERARQQLSSVARNERQPEVVRVAAIKALQEAMSDRQREEIFELFSRTQESNEIRISAYKSVVLSGASRRQLEQIQEVVKREQNNDIQQYVRSHQKNLRETSDPHKKYVLPSDAPQFQEPNNQWFGVSNNFESSFMFDALSVGVAVEADVVYPRGGQQTIPRSLTANFTVPLFGREVQLIEVEIRQKGFEEILRQRLRSFQLEEVFQTTLDVFQNSNQWSNQISSGDLQMQVHFKFDGKTVLSVDLQDVQQDYQQLWNQLRQQLQQRVDINRAFAVQPINTRIQLPTTNGLPLFVRLNATLVSTLKTSLKVSDLSRNSNNKIIDALIAPSIALQLEAGVEFLAQNHKKSVEVISRVSSSPVWDSKIEIRDNRVLNVKINLPKDRLSLIKVQSSVYQRDQNGQRQQLSQYQDNRSQSRNNQQKYCTQNTKKPFGIQFCSQYSPKFYELSIEKSDTTMKSFEFSLEKASQDSDLKNYRLSFNTPNSQVDRHISVEFQYQGQSSAKLDVRSPWMRYSVEGSVRNEDKEQSFVVNVDKEGRKYFSLDVGLQRQQRGQKVEYRPRVRIQLTPDSEPISMQGSVSVSKGRKNQLQINLEGNQKQFLKGSFVREGERKSNEMRVSSDLTINLPNLEIRLTGLADKGVKHAETDLTVEYRWRNQRKESLKISSKVQNLTQSQLTKLSAFGELTSTQLPQYNFHLAYNLLAKPQQQIENELTVAWTQNLNNKIHLLHSSKLDQDQVENSLSLEVTPLNINYELRANAQIQRDSQSQLPKYSGQVLGKDKTGNKENDLKFNFAYQHVSRSPLHLTLEANLKTQNRDLSYRDELKEHSQGEYQGNTQVQWHKGQKAELEYNYKLMNPMDSEMKHEMDFKMKTPSNHVIKHSGMLRLSPNLFQLKSKLNSNQNQIYSLDTLLSRDSASQVDAQALGYLVRVGANPYTVPQLASFEVSTPRLNSFNHKTNLEFIPKTSLSLKSDTKLNQKNVLAFDSHISRTTPSRITFTSEPVEGRVDVDLLSPESRRADLVIKSIPQDWTHSSQIVLEPKLQFKSKTISKGLPLVNIDSQYHPYSQSYVTIETPNQSSLSALYNNRDKTGNLEILTPNLRHKTDFEYKNEIRVNSETNRDRNQLNSFKYSYNPLNGVHALNSQLTRNLRLELEGKHWNSNTNQILEPFLRVNAKNRQYETNARIAKQLNNLKIETKVLKNQENIVDLDALLSAAEDSRVQFQSPQVRALVSVQPSQQQTRVEWNSPSVNHVTQVEYPQQEWSVDSKTLLPNSGRYLNLLGRHSLKLSLVSTKNSLFDSQLEYQPNNQRTQFQIQSNQISLPYNHVTEVQLHPNLRFDSKTNRNSQNLFQISGELNNRVNPSTVNLLIGPNIELKSRVQPFGPEKSLTLFGKHAQQFTHKTDLNLNQNSLRIKSNTLNNLGENLVKVDSYLTPLLNQKSHLTVLAPNYDSNLEFERQRSGKFEFNAKPYSHKTEIIRTGNNNIEIQSKTTKSGNNLLEINSQLNPNFYENQSFSLVSPQIETKVWKNQNSGKVQIKTQTIEHKSEVNAIPSQRSLNFNSKTKYNQNLLHSINGELSANNNNQIEVEVPYFVGKTGLNLAERSALLDYKSKYGTQRHLLASIGFNDGFHSDVAWDLDNDPNERVVIDMNARPDSQQSYNKQQTVYSLNLDYAGNLVKGESKMTSSDLVNGPHELNIQFIPKYNQQRDALTLNLKHVINNNQMQCNVDYTEGNQLKYSSKFIARLVGQSGVELSFENTSPQNPDLEVKVSLNERHSPRDLSLEIKAITGNGRQYLISGSAKREGNEIKGNGRIELPSVGQKNIEFSANDWNHVTFTTSGQSGNRELEYSSHVSPRSAQVDFKSQNLLFSFNLNQQNLNFFLDSNQQRIVSLEVQNTGNSLSDGKEIIARLESTFWPKLETKNSLKWDSQELQLNSNFKIDSKVIHSLVLSASRNSNVWSGTGSLDSSLISPQYTPLSVRFNAEKLSNVENKASISLSTNSQSVIDIKTNWKIHEASVFVPERVWLSLTKPGTNVEVKASFFEYPEQSSSSQSVLGLTQNQRVFWNIKNQILVSINSQSIGFDSIVTTRDRRNRAIDTSLNLYFPSNRVIQFKADLNAIQDFVLKTQITRDSNVNQPLLETTIRVQNDNQLYRAQVEVKSGKFQRSPKQFQIEVQKQNQSFKVFLDLSQNQNNALTIEGQLNQQTGQLTNSRFSRYSNDRNTTFNLEVSTRDKRLIDLQVSGHVSKQSFGFNYVNVNRRGQRQEGSLFVRSLANNNGNDKRFEGFLSNNNNNYKVLGNLAQNSNELNLRVIDQKSGQESDHRLALNNQCVQYEQRSESNSQNNQRYDLCANFNNKNDRIVSLSLDNNNNKQLDINLEIDTRVPKSLRLNANWDPNLVNQYNSRVPAVGQQTQQLFDEVLQEVSHKSQIVSEQFSQDILQPIVSLITDEFQDVFQQLFKNFDFLQNYWQQLNQYFEQLVQNVNHVVLEVLPSSVDSTVRDVYRVARKQCKRSQVCYKSLYALENYGLGSVWDLLLSNAQQAFENTHRFVVTTSGGLSQYFPSIPSSIRDLLQEYQQSIVNTIESIIDSNDDLREVYRHLKQIFSEVFQQNYSEINWNQIKESFNQIFDLVFNQKSSSRVVVWDPQRGRAQFEVRSPVIRRSFRSTDNNWNQIKSTFFS